LTSNVALATHLGTWTLVTSIIVAKFMVNQHSFFFETLIQVNNNTFFFQQHLKVTCDLLPPPVCTCLLPFEQLIEQQMVQLQDSISEHMHHHTLYNMFFDKINEAHCA
jgi:hypothetical protein